MRDSQSVAVNFLMEMDLEGFECVGSVHGTVTVLKSREVQSKSVRIRGEGVGPFGISL